LYQDTENEELPQQKHTGFDTYIQGCR